MRFGEHHDIAVIGMSCRFPEAENYRQFWHNLAQGTNSITPVPAERWSLEEYYSPKQGTPYKSISKWGGFIRGVDQFDASFFGISPREAERMDPQQRIALELSWECLEDAGYAPSALSGANVGIYMGLGGFDYSLIQADMPIEGYTALGTLLSLIPNRVSHTFNFSGPSVPVDTACSGALVAIHQAIQSLEAGDCEMALVGGSSILLHPRHYIAFSQLGMLSPTGQCRAFDQDADGYVRGEGIGLILLKPLNQAMEDGDRIYAVIKGSAVNHGGHARTLTSPNPFSQAKVISTAYENAGIDPRTISYIEAHGTGTPLGDPIEITGLKRAFRKWRGKPNPIEATQQYCGVGTVKTNIGHLEPAAGIAGIIKVILAMQHRQLPKLANFNQINPKINLEGSPFYLVKESQDWQAPVSIEGRILPLRAGVSSFGFGGVNVHIVLEEAPQVEVGKQHQPLEGNTSPPPYLFTLSAKNKQALTDIIERYAAYLLKHPDLNLSDICHTSHVGRSHFNHRLAMVVANRQDLDHQLAVCQQPVQPQSGICFGVLPSKFNAPSIAFLFPWQGAQYTNMARGLYEKLSVFRQALEQCDALLQQELGQSILDVIYPGQAEPQESVCAALLDQAPYTQPALFAIEYALAQLWVSWGIVPNSVVGYGVGEYVAACVAEVFSVADGLRLVAARGRLMQQCLVDEGGDPLTLSTEQAISLLESPSMEPVLAGFKQVAQQVDYRSPQRTFISHIFFFSSLFES